MNTASPTGTPARVKKGLLVFWAAWIVAVVLGLYPELHQIYVQMEALEGENPFQASTLTGLLLAVPFLMLTPKLFGSTVAAVMLVLVAKRKGWSRWVLLAGMIATGVALIIDVRALLAQGSPGSVVLFLATRGLLYLTMAVALAHFFSNDASAWFRSHSPMRNAT